MTVTEVLTAATDSVTLINEINNGTAPLRRRKPSRIISWYNEC